MLSGRRGRRQTGVRTATQIDPVQSIRPLAGKSLVLPAPLVVGGAVPPASREVDVVGRAPVERRVVVRRLHDDDEEAATS
jgi:hypothetical protein